MDAALYLSGDYLTKHPSWHVEDSDWKAAHVVRLIRRFGLEINSVIEIGCGAGQILHSLQQQLPADCHFTGYEISPQAFALCQHRANARLSFVAADGLSGSSGQHPHADLALALDVVEHVEDYRAFLRNMRTRAQYCIFHIPLDLSLVSLLTGLPLRVRRSAGHLHYFTRELALEALQECGFEVLHSEYTRPSIERPSANLRGRLARWPRLALATINEPLAATLLGGFSLIVLAQPKEKA